MMQEENKKIMYARLVYGNNRKRMASGQFINVGDYIQTFAIDWIYKQLGIEQDRICTIDRNKLYQYQGKKVKLPMQGCFGYIKGAEVFPIPNDIEPVFVGYSSVTKAHYKKKCIETYFANAPVCCRDEGTWKRMQQRGIEAYLTGCLTITLPERKKEPEDGKVFLVDAPPEVERYMPEHLRKKVVYVTHEIQWNQKNADAREQRRIEALSKKILERYKNEAALVITSRLHCAAPCMAMGIPVILVRNYFDERYMWIDKFLPLYTPDRFEEIDWTPVKVDLTEIKLLLLKMISAILNESDDQHIIIKQVHDFYMDRNRERIETPFHVKMYFRIREKFPRVADFIREVILKKYIVATARDKD